MKTKEKVLEILQNSGAEYRSGESMAEELKVTRAAVWKAVKTLQKDGVEIEAVTNRGYRLKQSDDSIDAAWIEEHLRDRGIDIRIFYFDEVTSTNDVVAELGRDHEGILLAIGGRQTKGRGRRGRDFYSPKDTGIYMSMLIRGNEPLEKFANLTATAAVSVAEGIDRAVFNGEDITGIKWVNDVYIGPRKISGTITEFSTSLEDPSQHSIVMGIGINVHDPKGEFPEDIRKKAGSLDLVSGNLGDHARNRIILEVMTNLFTYFDRKEEALRIYREKCFLIGEEIFINSFSDRVKENRAKVTGISDDFYLEVEYPDGRKDLLSSGEVSVVRQ